MASPVSTSPVTSCLRLTKWICCYLGIRLLYMPNDLNWYWGNLVVYVDSYNYALHPQVASNAPWLPSMFLSSWGVSLMIGAFLNKKLKTFHVAVLGVVIYDLGIFTSHLAIKQSIYLLYLSMGVVCGLGYGLIQSMVYLWIRDITVRYLGLAYSLLINCVNLGAIIINEFTTRYINPENLKASFPLGASRIFTEKSVVDRVPPYFLCLGAIVCGFHFSGLVLVWLSRVTEKGGTPISEPDETENSPALEGTKDIQKYGEEKLGLPEKIKGSKSLTIDERQTKTSTEYSSNISFTGDDDVEDYHCTDEIAKTDDVIPKNCGESSRDEIGACGEKGYTLRETLKSRSFYCLCLIVIVADVCYLCALNYYKKFGNVWLHDDHFLTLVGVLSSFFVLFMRIFWGVFVDKQGVKCTSVLLIALSSMVYSSYYVTPMISKWMFMVWTVMFSTLCTSLYLVFPVAIVKLFGNKYFADIYGATMATSVLTNLVAPPLLQVLLTNLGWSGLFLSVALLNFGVLVSTVLGLPSM